MAEGRHWGTANHMSPVSHTTSIHQADEIKLNQVKFSRVKYHVYAVAHGIIRSTY